MTLRGIDLSAATFLSVKDEGSWLQVSYVIGGQASAFLLRPTDPDYLTAMKHLQKSGE